MPKEIAKLTKEIATIFGTQFSANPTAIAVAPGRVNLIGEHLDYNDGWVLPAAIDRHTLFAAKPTEDRPTRSAVLFSSALNETVEISLDHPESQPKDHWSRYVAGVISCFTRQGIEVPSFQGVIHSNIPLGGGLASSAALEVATATLLESLTGFKLAALEKARLCQRAEQNFAGVPCGIMDQYTSVFGKKNKLLYLDCVNEKARNIPFPSDYLSILIIDSQIKHELSVSEYEKRRRESANARTKLGVASWRDVSPTDLLNSSANLSKLEQRRARHIVTEIARTAALVEAVSQRDFEALSDLLYASHFSLRDDYQVSCKALDRLVELSRQIPSSAEVFGSRMTGAGFGGCTVSLVKQGSAEVVAQEITSAYAQEFGIMAESFTTKPTSGAKMLTL